MLLEQLLEWSAFIFASVIDGCQMPNTRYTVKLPWGECTVAKLDEFADDGFDGPFLNAEAESYDTSGTFKELIRSTIVIRDESKAVYTLYQR